MPSMSPESSQQNQPLWVSCAPRPNCPFFQLQHQASSSSGCVIRSCLTGRPIHVMGDDLAVTLNRPNLLYKGPESNVWVTQPPWFLWSLSSGGYRTPPAGTSYPLCDRSHLSTEHKVAIDLCFYFFQLLWRQDSCLLR